MPEEDLETHELKEQIDERIEHSIEEHEARAAPKWLRYLSLSTAMIAVLAAVSSLESGARSNEAILEKSEAMLNQSRASDQWAFFQAKSMKSALAGSEAQIIADTKPDLAAKMLQESARYKTDTEALQKEAERLEHEVEHNNAESKDLMEHHHHFAIAVTLLQIAIAMSAIAALTRKQPLWFVSMAVSLGGLVMFILGFL